MAMKVRYAVFDGEVVSEDRGGTERDYVPDPLGSTVALIDGTQTQTDTFQYWPYGDESARTGTTPTPFRYVGAAGYYWDSSSKTFVRARELDKLRSRWLTPEARRAAGGGYGYAGNAPTTLTDPCGRQVVQLPPISIPTKPTDCYTNPNDAAIAACKYIGGFSSSTGSEFGCCVGWIPIGPFSKCYGFYGCRQGLPDSVTISCNGDDPDVHTHPPGSSVWFSRIDVYGCNAYFAVRYLCAPDGTVRKIVPSPIYGPIAPVPPGKEHDFGANGTVIGVW